MGNGNKKIITTSFSAEDINKNSTKPTTRDATKWSSAEVQHWIKHQCKKFELKKNTAEQFEMNGQALVLLTKHDFLRRAPNGGEVLYYALQRLINPNKERNSADDDENTAKLESSDQQPRIVEVHNDHNEAHDTTDSSSTKPIVEEPDDPPLLRKSQSDTNHDTHPQERNNRFFFSQAHFRPTVFAMPAAAAAAYLQQQQRYPNGYVYAQHHPHYYMHHPQFFQQYYPMMSAQGVLIETMDENEPTHATVNGSMNGAQDPSLFAVTINGQRYIMNEGQVIQLVGEVYQQHAYQANLQQQQQQARFQQQQQHFQQQQQQQQQQQRFYSQPYHFQQQIDTVSRSQRSLFAEYERQRSRLDQLVRSYDNQQSARDSELRRQSEQISKETRRRIHYRSHTVITERARLQHILDNDINNLFSSDRSNDLFHLKTHSNDRKRKVYGCLLPKLKAPLKKNSNTWTHMISNSNSRQSNFEKHMENHRNSINRFIELPIEQRNSINSFIESPNEQRNKMNLIMDKFLYELQEGNGDGYDHFLQTSEPNRNAQILAQQNIKNKNRKLIN
ncbi:unnamed protein product [Rotaria sp. Silwood1]|nr:unnamed protein product [Rotaria sp. Silwood1]CAF1001496.1 unnamed protein product [Rotaria sp. Silwood1]CAF3411310.1 unnamed protein product [Rotaria sp. Silwood1]CAF4599412.1 unnamed protein product [Rotaria sp. Silwood1]